MSVLVFREHPIDHHREAMLSIIKVINEIDQELMPIILWLNYNGFETSSCCTGHPISPSYKGRSYEIFGYIHFRKTPKFVKLLEFLEKNGFEIVSKDSSIPVARIVFVEVKNGKVVHHYKDVNKLNITQREINVFWKNIFEQMRYLKEEI